jgi:hypothetical protein
VRREAREVIADWLVVGGAVTLLISLFLVWSHQYSRGFVTKVGAAQLQGVPRDPTAWQVYSIADVLLAVLAGALVLAALVAGRRARISALVAAGVGLVFVVHAMSVAPTNGANVSDPSAGPGQFFASSATSGAGEVVAAIALGVAIAGLALSFTAD